jgi:Zn-dependent peptidase ImmA (M78 family)
MSAKHVTVPLSPEVLVWARTSIAKDPATAAKSAGVPTQRLLAWEAGAEQPSLPQLEALSTAYKRPVAAFFLASAPREAAPPTDFRTLPEGERRALSEPTIMALRRGRQVQELAEELAESVDAEAPRLDVALVRQDPEESARRLRNLLGWTGSERRDWRDRYAALRGRIDSIDALGVIVLQLSMPLAETRGFSLTDGPFPVIAVSTKDQPEARSFSLLHEFVHVVSHTGGMCDMRVGSAQAHTPSGPLEVFCNHVAAAALVPRDVILAHSIVIEHGEHPEWTDDELGNMARTYRVSREVILRRLLTLGRTSEAFYRHMRSVWGKQRNAESTGFSADKPAEVLRKNGRLFSGMVLEGLHTGSLSLSSAADYLGTKPKHIRDVEHLVMSR